MSSDRRPHYPTAPRERERLLLLSKCNGGSCVYSFSHSWQKVNSRQLRCVKLCFFFTIIKVYFAGKLLLYWTKNIITSIYHTVVEYYKWLVLQYQRELFKLTVGHNRGYCIHKSQSLFFFVKQTLFSRCAALGYTYSAKSCVTSLECAHLHTIKVQHFRPPHVAKAAGKRLTLCEAKEVHASARYGK